MGQEIVRPQLFHPFPVTPQRNELGALHKGELCDCEESTEIQIKMVQWTSKESEKLKRNRSDEASTQESKGNELQQDYYHVNSEPQGSRKSLETYLQIFRHSNLLPLQKT
ncbi:hypothetical protein TNCV_2014251 [Trichonephila clavipes]|nr:hypothetical protein TNCV_2014251 [Trichonephila clavipes]